MPIAYIEVGVEHVDAQYLKRMRKPYTLKQLEKLAEALRKYNKYSGHELGFIPNIMFSLPDADYTSTVEWVNEHREIISFINPFILCAYHNAHGAMVEGERDDDSNENVFEKSWLTPEEAEASRGAFTVITGVQA
jgi:hypothetical protein